MDVEGIAMNLEIGALLTSIHRHSIWWEKKKNNDKNFSRNSPVSEPKNERSVSSLNIDTYVM
jgi:hypothetical protein